MENQYVYIVSNSREEIAIDNGRWDIIDSYYDLFDGEYESKEELVVAIKRNLNFVDFEDLYLYDGAADDIYDALVNGTHYVGINSYDEYYKSDVPHSIEEYDPNSEYITGKSTGRNGTNDTLFAEVTFNLRIVKRVEEVVTDDKVYEEIFK